MREDRRIHKRLPRMRSCTKQPHERVLPERRADGRTQVVSPQSHRHSTPAVSPRLLLCAKRSSTTRSTVSLPNRSPGFMGLRTGLSLAFATAPFHGQGLFVISGFIVVASPMPQQPLPEPVRFQELGCGPPDWPPHEPFAPVRVQRPTKLFGLRHRRTVQHHRETLRVSPVWTWIRPILPVPRLEGR